MPGTLTFKPLSAKLKRNTEFLGTMDPYCRIFLGKQKVQSQVCKNGGKHPHWEDTLVLKRGNEQFCHVELKEKDWLLPDDLIGACDVNLSEVENQKRVLKWYPVSYNSKNIGQLLLEIEYKPDQAPINPKAVEPLSNQATVIQQGNAQDTCSHVQNIPASQQGHQVPPIHYPQGVYTHQQTQGFNAMRDDIYQINQGLQQQAYQPPHQNQLSYQEYPQQKETYPQLDQRNMWAPSFTEYQEDSNYPQKYPQFDSSMYQPKIENNNLQMGAQNPASNNNLNQNNPQKKQESQSFNPLRGIKGLFSK